MANAAITIDDYNTIIYIYETTIPMKPMWLCIGYK